MTKSKPLLQLPKTSLKRLQKSMTIFPVPEVDDTANNFKLQKVVNPNAGRRRDLRFEVICIKCGTEQEIGWIMWLKALQGKSSGRCKHCPSRTEELSANGKKAAESKVKAPVHDTAEVNRLMAMWKPPGVS